MFFKKAQYIVDLKFNNTKKKLDLSRFIVIMIKKPIKPELK